MRDLRNVRGWLLAGLAVLGALVMAAGMAEGHAILKSSSPAANSTVTGPDVPVILQFNVRVDARRSKMQLLHPDNSVTELPLENKVQVPVDTLASKATGLAPGNYKIQWQVLAPDGHITRGEVPFTVKAN